MTGGQVVVGGQYLGAEAPGCGAVVRVWGSRGKGGAQPLASGALDEERSGVGQSACLRSFSTAEFVLQGQMEAAI
ncbi:hypothetical protein ASE96_05010 [Arthrobacter sp. Leaf69]|nr:hypothetical protein ASE96_05010 [Arthrobacter sp. Leaf69]